MNLSNFKINLGGTVERVVWTIVQAVGGYIGQDSILPANSAEWKHWLLGAGLAGLLALLKVLGIAATVTNTTPAVGVAQVKVIEASPEPVLPVDHPVDTSSEPVPESDGGYKPVLDENGNPIGKHVA